MNEKIREFAIQSGLPTALDYHQKRYEKFAELIIWECAAYAFSDDQDRKTMLKDFGVMELDYE